MASEKQLADVNALLEEVNRTIEIMEQRREHFSLRNLIMCIKNAPTVDAVEVVHAEWACVNESENVWMCTGNNGCGGEMIILEKTPLENGFTFCPYCGSDMR